MRDLTPHERQVYELRTGSDPPLTYAEVGKRLGMTEKTAETHFRRARVKIEANPGLYQGPGRDSVEMTDPDRAAEIIDLVTDPALENLKRAAAECNLPLDVTRNLLDRMRRNYLPVKSELERIKTETLVRQFENLAHSSLESITKGDLENLDAYKRTLIAAIATDKRELLDGRPTERISVEDRRKLPELIGALMSEARRRGLTDTMDPETGEVRLTHMEEAPYQVRAGRERMPRLDESL